MNEVVGKEEERDTFVVGYVIVIIRMLLLLLEVGWFIIIK